MVAPPRPAQTQPAGKKLINLLRGWPSPHLLPAERLRAATNLVLSDPATSVLALQYGLDPGYQPLRQELARWLGGAYGQGGDAADPERLCVTGGASQGLACILASFSEPGHTLAVWVSAPCYFMACPIFEDAGFAGRMRAVAEDEEGVDLVALEEGLRREEARAEENGPVSRPSSKNLGPQRKTYRHLIYVVPTCANPSGKAMTLRRREGLVQLARKHDALVICDDVYDFLQWSVIAPSESMASNPPSSPLPFPPNTPLPRLTDIDRALGPSVHELPDQPAFGHAVSNGSFSKLVGPGVRTGWAEGTRAFALGLSTTGATRSGGAPSQLVAAAIAEMMRAGDLDAHIAGALRPALRRRHAVAVEAVGRVLGKFGVRVSGGDGDGDGSRVYGGYFLWLTLRDGGPCAAEVAERAKEEENLVVAEGGLFEVAGDEEAARFPMNIRLCYSWEDEEDIVEGVERLGQVLERLEREQATGASQGTADGRGKTGDFRLEYA